MKAVLMVMARAVAAVRAVMVGRCTWLPSAWVTSTRLLAVLAHQRGGGRHLQ